MLHRLDIKTRSRVELQDVTARVQDVIKSTSIRNGVCCVFVTHTTAGITVNEHADPTVAVDIATHLTDIVPQHGNYRHTEGNAPAHIKAALVGNSHTLLVEDGKLVLGTWQGVFFCEFDGPRNRTMLIRVLPDERRVG